MSTTRIALIVTCLLLGVSAVRADTTERNLTIHLESEVFATRGDAVITQADFDARLDRIPEEHRQGVLADPQRIDKMLDDEMLLRLLAEDGIQAGLLDDDLVQALLWQSAMNLIAERHVRNVLEEAALEDYTQQAREIWLAGTHRSPTPEKFDFTHLLISNKTRSEAEAARIALDLQEQLEQGASFDELIEQYSEDPSVSDNRGRFTAATADDLDPEFMAALARLQSTGEISEPVRSEFGWHIIRLDEHHPAQEMDYEEALPQLLEIAKGRHRDHIRDQYYARLQSQPRDIADGAVQKLLKRYGTDQLLTDED